MQYDDQKTREYYASRAAYYDEVYERSERADDIAFLKGWLPLRVAHRNVIEVACGTGYWTQHIAAWASSVVATDGTRETIEIARTRPGCRQVSFSVADAFSLPVREAAFDAAFAGLWLSHVPRSRRAEFLNGLHRALRPGARVVFIDNTEAQCRDLPIVAEDAEGNTYQERKLRDGTSYRILKNFPCTQELGDMIEGVGIQPAYRQLRHFWCFDYILGP